MSLLNQKLAQENRLLLPRIEKDEIVAYHVENLNTLIPNQLGILQPDPSICMQATQVDAILVPALGFDQNYNRLGYGKGFYDKYLAKHPHIPHIGVGFKEQLVKSLPTESHDISLSALSLF